MSPSESNALRFLWWNVQDHAHYADASRDARRWPSSAAEFDEKTRRLAVALRHVSRQAGPLHLVGLGEVTRVAAERLRDEALPGYEVFSLDLDDGRPVHDVAWLAAPRSGFVVQMPIMVPDLPRTTRKMHVIDFVRAGTRIRFVACHWPAFEDARGNRRRIADHLSHELFDFLHPDAVEPGVARHAVVVGDMNEEPFTLSEGLRTHRARGGIPESPSWQDRDVRRVHLYDCGWRWLGERRALGEPPSRDEIDAAGTCFYEPESRWVTFDHILVSAGLLGASTPRLDERQTDIVRLSACAPEGGAPRKFTAAGGIVTGVSDHLPVSGCITLDE